MGSTASSIDLTFDLTLKINSDKRKKDIQQIMDVSIIIVNYNTWKMTAECIKSVIDKTKDLTYEIILVDNASTDGSREFFEKNQHIIYLYNSENLGFGRANNLGLKIAKGRNILF